MKIRDKAEFDVTYLHQTDKAVLINYEGKEYWIPDSQIDEDSEAYVGCKLDKGEKVTLICSEWIALNKGMI